MKLKDLIFSGFSQNQTSLEWADAASYKYINENVQAPESGETIPLLIGACLKNDEAEISEDTYILSDNILSQSYNFGWSYTENSDIAIWGNESEVGMGTSNACAYISDYNNSIYLYGDSIFFNDDPLPIIPDYSDAENGAVLTKVHVGGGDPVLDSEWNFITEIIDWPDWTGHREPTHILVDPTPTDTLNILCTSNKRFSVSQPTDFDYGTYVRGVMIDEDNKVIYCSDCDDKYLGDGWTNVKQAMDEGWYNPCDKYFRFVDLTYGFGNGTPSLKFLEPNEMHNIRQLFHSGDTGYKSTYLYQCLGTLDQDDGSILLEFNDERVYAPLDKVEWKKPESLTFCVESIDSLKTYHEINDGPSSGQDEHSLFEVSETYDPNEPLVETKMLKEDGWDLDSFKYSIDELRTAKFTFHVYNVDGENKYFAAIDCVPSSCYLVQDRAENNTWKQVLVFHIAEHDPNLEQPAPWTEKSVILTIVGKRDPQK